MTAFEGSSDDDIPLASKYSDAGVKNESKAAGEDKVKAKAPARNKSTEGGSGKAKAAKAAKAKTSEGGKKGPSTDPQKRVKKESGRKPSSGEKSEGTKRPKKVYDLPGQTRDTPPEEDPLRQFYMSLLEQVPTSELARKWCVVHGLLPVEEAKKWVAKYGKKTAAANTKRKAPAGASNGSSTKKAKASTTASKKGKKRAPATKTIYKDDPSDSDDEVLPVKRSREVAKSPKIPAGASGSRFKDTMNFSDSDSDIPLAQKVGK